MRASQSDHWWYRGRRDIIQAVLRKHIRRRSDVRILDIGAGFGSMIPVLQSLGRVDAIEPNHAAHELLQAVGAERVAADISSLFRGSECLYDVIVILDVLEHIRDDSHFLESIRNLLVPNSGVIVLTVPAYSWLWSEHDEQNEHYRRYTARRIKRLFERAHYHCITVGYFMTLLFPFAAIHRLISRVVSISLTRGTKAGVLNALLARLFASERYAARSGLLPYGLSVLTVASPVPNEHTTI
jgi:SAM-dependent methyltransferase